MKILQVIPNLGCGGAEHFVCDLALEMRCQGQTCDILTLFDIEPDNSILARLEGKISVYSLHKKPGFQISTFFKLIKFIKKGGYDVVNAHVGAIKYIFLTCIFRRRLKYFATIHSDAKFEAGYSLDKYSRVIMFKFGLCKAITISEESNRSFENFYNVKATTIYNGVSDYIPSEHHTPIRANKNDVIFIHPASCQEVKNQRMLFNAFKRLEKLHPNVFLYWVGSNQKFYELFQTLEPLITDRISYIGMVDNVRDYLIESDAMCLTSKIEGMPITIIESFSVGCVPICTPVGGCVNMIEDGVNGLLSTDVSEDSYFEVLQRFVEMTSSERKTLHNKAAESFQKYNIHFCVNQYISIYQK